MDYYNKASLCLRLTRDQSRKTIGASTTLQREMIQKQKGQWNGYSGSYAIGANLRKGQMCILNATDKVESDTYASLWHECAKLKSIADVKLIHARMLVNGMDQNVFLGNKLVSMYSNCGNLGDARLVFDKMTKRNVFSWTEIIGAYARHGHGEEALTLYYQMQRAGTLPDNFILPSILKACAGLPDLQQGKEIHAYIVRSGFESDVCVGNALIHMYAKCRCVHNARQVFDNMAQRDVVSWNAIIAGYIQDGNDNEALKLFRQMQLARIKLNVISWNSMIAGYAKNGHKEEALKLFQQMQLAGVKPCGITWNAIIAGCTQNGYGNEALKLFQQMQLEGLKPSSATVVSVLPACARISALEQGKEIHGYIIRKGFQADDIVGNALIDMYAKCGRIECAQQVFDKMSRRDVVSWTSMIAGYAQNGHGDKALKLFLQMQLAGIKPDVVSWNVMIAWYAENGQSGDVLNLFHQMQLSGVKPDIVTWNVMIARYAQSGHGDEAFQLFSEMQLEGVMPDVVTWNAMIAGYARNGHCEKAFKLFLRMQLAGIKSNVITWNAMITGCAQNGHGGDALKLFCQMQTEGLKANSITIASVLPACAHLASLQQGKEIHNYTLRNGFESDVFVGNSLMDMYTKCGSLADAYQVFDRMFRRDVVSWNTMIAGLAMHGNGEDALKIFHQMQQEGVKPAHITFTGVLSACSHAGLVEEGWQYFDSMSRDYFIQPSMEHYACMVDLLGRAGCLDEAYNFIDNMPLEPHASVWGALLSACRIHSNVYLGKYVGERLFELEPENAGNYVLLSNIYAEAGRWNDAANTRKKMKDRGVKKRPGCSWIEVNNSVNAFLAGLHPQREKDLGNIVLPGKADRGALCTTHRHCAAQYGCQGEGMHTMLPE